MKAILTFFTVIFIGWNVYSQENLLPAVQSDRSDVFSLDSLRLWLWDSTGVWYLYHRTVYTYDDNQNILTETVGNQDGFSNWVNEDRVLNTYDDDNRLTSTVKQSWNGADWEIYLQTLYTYDSNGDKILALDQVWDGTAWKNSIQNTYTYDSNHHELTSLFQIWLGSDWNAGTRRVSTYNANGQLSVKVNQNYSMGTWNDISRTLYTYDANEDLDTLLFQKWNLFVWIDDYRTIYDYDDNHHRTFIIQQLAVGIGFWEDDQKYEYTYDQFGLITHLIFSRYESGAWTPVYQYNVINDEDQNRSTEVRQSWSGEWVNQDSTQYYYTNLTGVSAIIDPYSFVISPNPARDQLNIEFENAFDGCISVYSMQGVKMSDQRCSSEYTSQLDVSLFKPGQYVIMLRSGNNIIAKTFQKL